MTHNIIQNMPWKGLHLQVNNNSLVGELVGALPELAEIGVNVIIAEVNYHFAYDTHPELRESGPEGVPGYITREAARGLSAACRALGIRLIPQFQCLGHQSWAKQTFALLRHYPEFDETPGQYPDNEGIYCRSWCPSHPEVNPIIYDLFDELIEAFEADALHVGLDEVFLIGSDHCPRCRGHAPADLFAQAVKDYHRHLVGQRGMEMLMWGDRLLDDATTGYGEWEASRNGTAAAIKDIPKDIIICDWHYELRDAYPSIPIFLDRGFRVLPAGWRNEQAVSALIADAQKVASPLMLGYLGTTWSAVRPGETAHWPPVVTAMHCLG